MQKGQTRNGGHHGGVLKTAPQPTHLPGRTPGQTPLPNRRAAAAAAAVMSSVGDTNVVLRGVTHGAVDFLIKPVRIEELRNVWQHVVRRRSMALVRTPEDGQSDDDSLVSGWRAGGAGRG